MVGATVRASADHPSPLLNQGGESAAAFSYTVVSRRIMKSSLGMTLVGEGVHMKGKERVLCVLRRSRPDCVPVLPQIWLDHAARISGIDPLSIMEHPELGFRAMLITARHYGLDGFRTFLIYKPRRVVREGAMVYEVDPATGEKIGLIDFEGGWGVKPFEPPKYVQDLDDVARIPVPSAQSYWDDGHCEHLRQVVQEAGENHLVVGRARLHYELAAGRSVAIRRSATSTISPAWCMLCLKRGCRSPSR